MLKRIGIALAIAVAGALLLDGGGRIVAPGEHALISTAKAEVGRPLTPMSIAGVSRRTARRCAAGVYNC